MEMFTIGESNNVGGYFSSEQIDLLSIIQSKSHEELESFVSNCEQVKKELNEEELTSYHSMSLEDAKKMIFKRYQNTLVSYFSTKDEALANTLSKMDLSEEEIEVIKKVYQEKSKEVFSYIRDYIKTRYPRRVKELFHRAHRVISRERDQNKDSDLYDEFEFLDSKLASFDTMLIGSAKPEVVINKMCENNDTELFDFYFAERDLTFALRNDKQVRLHSLLTKGACEETFKGYSKEEVLEMLNSYVKKTIDFVTNYNSTHKLVNGQPVIQAIDLFNEIVSFDVNKNGEYENIWEEKYGISIQDICNVFRYAQEHKPEGVSYLYNEPFLEDPKRRKKVIEVLNEINENSPGLIDTLGSQMHITISTPEEQIRDCFSDFKRVQEEKGLNIQITEFDLSLSERELMMIIGENPKATYELAYEMKESKISNIDSIIKSSGVNLSGISYWSLTDKIDCNLERARTNLLDKGVIENIEEVPTVCGGLFPTAKKKLEIKNNSEEVVSNRAR